MWYLMDIHPYRKLHSDIPWLCHSLFSLHIFSTFRLSYSVYVPRLWHMILLIPSGTRSAKTRNMIRISLLVSSFKNSYVDSCLWHILQIVIVTNEEETRAFKREVGEEALPEEYGGQAKLTPLQDFELKPLDD